MKKFIFVLANFCHGIWFNKQGDDQDLVLKNWQLADAAESNTIHYSNSLSEIQAEKDIIDNERLEGDALKAATPVNPATTPVNPAKEQDDNDKEQDDNDQTDKDDSKVVVKDPQENDDEKVDSYITSETILKPLSTGRQKSWTVYKHADFPRYALRTSESESKKGLCDSTVKQVSGYLDVDDEKHFYFWFFESRDKPETDPLVLWLNGGPGCSSLTGLLMELGPCRPTKGGESTVPNKYSWNSNANIIFLDQPVNVGFSYTEGKSPTNSDDAGQDVYAFLELFIQTYPKYAKLPFTVTGESYAGHYIPAIAHAIQEANLALLETPNPRMEKVNMVSIAIGNGLTDPLVQYKHYSEMACDTKYGPILPQAECDAMDSKYPTCKSLISSCYKYKTPFTCVPGSFYCNSAMINPFQKTGLNIYDIRKECDASNPLCYDILNDIEAYLNDPAVQEELGVDVAYEGCKRDINMNFLLAGDWMRPYVDYIAPLLEADIKVLIYAVCNWFGNKAWTLALEWSGQDKFVAAKDITWISKVTGKPAGEVRGTGNFMFVRVYEAGHMVPYDQPEHSLEMINYFLHGHKALGSKRRGR